MQRQGPQPGILGTPHVEQQAMFYVFPGDPPPNQLANARGRAIALCSDKGFAHTAPACLHIGIHSLYIEDTDNNCNTSNRRVEGVEACKQQVFFPLHFHRSAIHQPVVRSAANVEQETMFYVLTGDPPSNQLADEHSCHIHFVRGHGQQLQYKETQLQVCEYYTILLLTGPSYTNWWCGQAFIVISAITRTNGLRGTGTRETWHPWNVERSRMWP